MEEAFLTGAGFSASSVSLFLRVVILSTFLLWSAWSVWKQFKMVVNESLTIGEWFFNVIANITILTGIAIITS